jgi:hypothetical protein
MSVDSAYLQHPPEVVERESGERNAPPGFFSNRRSLYVTFWLLVPLILPTCALLYALPLAPILWLSAKIAGTTTSNHNETLGLIVLITSFLLGCVTVGSLWQRTRAIARSLP